MPAQKNEAYSFRKWIVPPGLKNILEKFDVRCEMYFEDIEQGKSRPIIVHGSTGIGKSLFIDYFVYKFFEKKGTSLVFTINCAAISEKLLESELFGYVKGAHNTAYKDHDGFFQAVGKGILILEEIGELPQYLQAKLLIAIEKREFSKVGSTKREMFKGHVVATTNASWESFRSDFWYRFDTFYIPSLYERREDILYYFYHFDQDLLKLLPRYAVIPLLAYHWPGNVREIERVCNDLRAVFKKEATEYAPLIISGLATFARKACDDNIDIKAVSGAIKADHDEMYSRYYNKIKKDMKIHFDLKTYKPNGLHGEVFDIGTFAKLVSKFEDSYCNINIVEKMLNGHGLSLKNNSKVFWAEDNNTIIEKYRTVGPYFQFFRSNYFLSSYCGFLYFFKMLFVDNKANHNLVKLECLVNVNSIYQDVVYKGNDPHISFSFDGFDSSLIKSFSKSPYNNDQMKKYIFIKNTSVTNIAKWPKKYQKAFLELLKFQTEINKLHLEDVLDFTKFIEDYKGNKFIKKITNQEEEEKSIGEEIPVELVNLDELLYMYYETLLSHTGTGQGCQASTAKIAGVSPARVSQFLKKSGLKKGLNKFKFGIKRRLIFLK